MQTSDRILTTHVGSLPRPDDLVKALSFGEQQAPKGAEELANKLRYEVMNIVREQSDVGLDIVNDGEFGKLSFITYAGQRLGGLQERPGERPSPFTNSRDALSFPEFYAQEAQANVSAPRRRARMVCTGPIYYKGHQQLQTDIDNLKAALVGTKAVGAFIPAIAPSNIEVSLPNEFYATSEEYLFAIAEAMSEEYKAIIAAGLTLQIDDPYLVSYYITRPDLSKADCIRWAETRIEALNHALRGIPLEKIRLHTCYSINMGPRTNDLELKDVADLFLKINAGAYSFEAANPRHDHEWEVWGQINFPDEKLLMPGVITQSTVLVEHPELVAQRIVRFAKMVGRERVIASADCGFSSYAGANEIHSSIVWAKFAALVEGARIASQRLWLSS
jgi:5-methyltetrahydropteroyltriglutamate--homocysteine methyltransferase